MQQLWTKEYIETNYRDRVVMVKEYRKGLSFGNPSGLVTFREVREFFDSRTNYTERLYITSLRNTHQETELAEGVQ